MGKFLFIWNRLLKEARYLIHIATMKWLNKFWNSLVAFFSPTEKDWQDFRRPGNSDTSGSLGDEISDSDGGGDGGCD